MVLSKVGPFQPPDNSVLKFPMIFFSSTYKFRKRTLVPFLTISVLYENSCSHVLVFSAAQASLYADGTYFIFPHCLAISNSPSSLTQTSPSPSPSLPLALSLPSSLPPLSSFGYAKTYQRSSSGHGYFAAIFLPRELRSYLDKSELCAPGCDDTLRGASWSWCLQSCSASVWLCC